MNSRSAMRLVPLVALVLLAVRRRRVRRVLRVSRAVADLDRAEAFHRDGLGLARVAAGPCDPALPAILGLPGTRADQVVMRLGRQEIALVRFDPPGAPHPAGGRADDHSFQHPPLLAADPAAPPPSVAALHPAALSDGGPATLPPGQRRHLGLEVPRPGRPPAGADPFPAGAGGGALWRARPGVFLGLDHSALTVRDTARSLHFYRRLGFRVAARSQNEGEAQARLDGLPAARAAVTSLRPPGIPRMGLELLCYAPPGRPAAPWPANDAVTDWTTLLVPGLRRPRLLRDPDGHRMLLVGSPGAPPG